VIDALPCMSPEQLQGRRVDLARGCLYEMATGQRPSHTYNKLVPFVGFTLWKYCLFLSSLGVRRCRVGRHDTQLYTGDKTHLTKQLARDVSHRSAMEQSRTPEFGSARSAAPVRQHSGCPWSAQSAATARTLANAAWTTVVWCSQLRVGV
jgi:hypothetical protein